jgi:CheY-like chemotaxis protein
MKKILVAEDNDSNYMLMTYILKNHYEFFRAINGKEAIEKAKSECPDLILMDLKMPQVDGLEATRQIKAALPDMPVIALTANAFDTDRQQALEAGCNDFMTKPINAAKCLQMIEEYLK